jgi:cell division protein FtsB
MFILLFGIPITAYVLFSSRGVFARVSLEWEQRRATARIERAVQEQDSLKLFIQRLESDTLLIERLAREKYGMVKPGERVFIVDETTVLPKK